MIIFASHAADSWIGAWLIHGAWGLSDSSEQFVFLSGLMLGSVFALKTARQGAAAASRDMLIRAVRLYRTNMVVFAPPVLGTGTPGGFNPLSWQILFLVGAWLGRRSLLLGQALPRWRWLGATWWTDPMLMVFGCAILLCFALWLDRGKGEVKPALRPLTASALRR